VQPARFWYDAAPSVAWTPHILTEFEIGQAMAAIEAVARMGKPLAEVGSRVGNANDLKHDLDACLQSTREGATVKAWMREWQGRWRYGFYSAPWVLRALDFLDQEMPAADRHWISGLLFGYRPDAIQRFIDSGLAVPPVRVEPTSSRPTDSGSNQETARQLQTALARHS
jgi:hypothetical protein